MQLNGHETMPLHGSLKKSSDAGPSPRPNRASCLRNRHRENNKDSAESRSSSPSHTISPFSSRRSSCDEFIPFPTGERKDSDLKSKESGDDNQIHGGSTELKVMPSSKKAVMKKAEKEKKMTIVVNETRFAVDNNLFASKPDTMLAKMFSSCMVDERGWTKPNEKGEYEISEGLSAIIFKAILEYYTKDTVTCPPGIPVRDLRSACEYFLIPFNHETIKCENLGAFMHEISNDGARLKFLQFLDNDILPLMVKVAQCGDRECHIVVLTDDDNVEWDPDFPPQMGEEYTEIIKSTHLHRFLRYIENREVAKTVLKERGMKKIRLGIEGYPISMDTVKRRSSGRQEVIYDYVQRSFIAMSWEKEESKSRHVDFQCVNKSKSITNLVAAAADTPQDHGLFIQAEAEMVDMPVQAIRDPLELDEDD